MYKLRNWFYRYRYRMTSTALMTLLLMAAARPVAAIIVGDWNQFFLSALVCLGVAICVARPLIRNHRWADQISSDYHAESAFHKAYWQAVDKACEFLVEDIPEIGEIVSGFDHEPLRVLAVYDEGKVMIVAPIWDAQGQSEEARIVNIRDYFRPDELQLLLRKRGLTVHQVHCYVICQH